MLVDDYERIVSRDLILEELWQLRLIATDRVTRLLGVTSRLTPDRWEMG